MDKPGELSPKQWEALCTLAREQGEAWYESPGHVLLEDTFRADMFQIRIWNTLCDLGYICPVRNSEGKIICWSMSKVGWAATTGYIS